MRNSRTSGDSRRRGRQLRKFYNYCNILNGRVKSDLDRSPKEAPQGRPDFAGHRNRGREEKPGREGGHPPSDDAIGGNQQLHVVGATTIECFGREPGGPIVRFELSGPNGETISFPIRCGLFAAGGDHD